MTLDARSTGLRKWRVAAAALVLLVVTLVWRGGSAVRELSAALRYQGEPSESVVTVRPLGGAAARPLDGGPAVDLGGLERAVLFVFDPACAPTRGNMWNWVDLLAAADGRPVRALVVTLDGIPGAAEFWRGLHGRVEVAAVDSATMRNRLRVEATPATLLVEDGAVRRVYAGPLNGPAKQEVIDWLGRTPGAEPRKR
ncbi:MAG TPA: hypothetical protein VGV85_14710 [Longimicrobiaceae bacterium]|nr:hypothetical protein [Longimicrobiaceae bacterium]